MLLDRDVFIKNYAGNIDKILGKNDNFEIIVERNGTKVTHSTALDCAYISFDPKWPFLCKIDYAAIEYLIKNGFKNFTRLPNCCSELLNNTNDDMETLLSLLKKINSGEIQIETFEDGNFTFIKKEEESIISEINRLACNCLIKPDGRCYWKNHAKLEDEGFHVFALEQDSFGWLIGGIITNKGIISYG